MHIVRLSSIVADVDVPPVSWLINSMYGSIAEEVMMFYDNKTRLEDGRIHDGCMLFLVLKAQLPAPVMVRVWAGRWALGAGRWRWALGDEGTSKSGVNRAR
eukprot:scaffold341093_cov70-Cyclotella_meneghiniana.AAC.1